MYLHLDCLKSNCICLQKHCVKVSEYISGVQPSPACTFCALSRVFLTVYSFSTSLHARLPQTSKALMKFIPVMSHIMHSDLSMQKEFDIKWKSHDISGSASLALWANMNQSTTQLGSKRQSQGKHPYSTINIFICCSVVIICPVSIYFYVSSFFFFSVIFAQVYI